MTTTAPPSIGHSSASSRLSASLPLHAKLLPEIVQIRLQNNETLAAEQDGRRRRDNTLTSAALLTAELMAAGVHASADQLRALAAELNEAASKRLLAAPASFLARLVCGGGRHPNTYTRLGAAALLLARLPAGERAPALADAGGVTGLAQRAGRDAEKGANGAPSPLPTLSPTDWSRGLVSLAKGGVRRTVSCLVEVGGDEVPRVVLADVPGVVQLTVPGGHSLSAIDRKRLLDHGGRLEGETATAVRISTVVMAMVAAGHVRVEACASGDDTAACAHADPS